MTAAHVDGPATASGEPYRALLAVSEAIVSHRDLSALFHELAGRLHHVVRFDYLALLLHEAASNTLRLHVLETSEPAPHPSGSRFPVDDNPAGRVWQTQQPLIISNVAEQRRWPQYLERAQPFGVQSSCQLPLTTARRRLGMLVFACKQPSAYDAADVGFLQLVANQVAVAVENALAFQDIEAAFREIAALKDQLAKEKAYLEEEVRTEHHFGEIVGESPALRRVLKQVETVAPTDSTVLIRGETGTGKELIARALHDLSPRRERTFVKLNCAAIPTGLLESELFGHEKGAFTGAIGQKVGRFELAHRGTLIPRRGRRHPPGAATQAAPRAAGAGVRAAGRHEDDQSGRAPGGGHQPRPGADGRRRPLPRGPLLPPERLPAGAAAAAGAAATTSRGWSATSPSGSPGGWAGRSRRSRPRSWRP